MKKTFFGVFATVMVFLLGSTTVFAAGPGCGRYFADADGDGICDNAGSICVYEDADGDGFCDVCGTGHGNCPAGNGGAFIDADGDGVCDNYAAGQGRGNGCGRGNGFRSGRGRV